MEKVFKLYQSGIHMADICFAQGQVLASSLDTGTLEFGPQAPLDEEALAYYKKKYLLDLGFVCRNYGAICSAFQAGTGPFTVSDQIAGEQEFIPHGEYAHIYAGRKGQNPPDILFVDGDIRGVIASGREWVTVLVQEGWEEQTPLKLWDRKDVSKPVCPVTHKGTTMITMRDGVALATEIWLPQGVEKCDAILVRTPYGRLSYMGNYDRYVMRGYAVCIQDVRGRGGSQGEWVPKYHEMDDGSDTIDFIAAQPWSTGRVGMIGGSYLGCVQWSAAASGNPHLKALVSIVTSGDPFTDMPRKGGAFASGYLAWSFSVKSKEYDAALMDRQDWDELVKLRPVKDIPEMVFGEEIGFWSKWCSHEKYDAFWEHCNWNAHRDKIKVPAMIVSGWYDDNGMATSQALEIVEGYAPGDKKVVLGAWMHNGNSRREIHGIPLGNNCIRYDIDLLYLQWLDNKLKGMDNGADRGDRVEYYMAGKDQWIACNSWLPENAVVTHYYLSGGGRANTSGGDGTLSTQPPQEEGSDAYLFDPANPAPHIIDISENEICVPENYRDVEKREDVLCYTSAVLEEELLIAGDAYVEFYADSTARDTDFVVRLTDVDGQGNSVRLSDGLLRAKFRNGFDRIELLEEGKVERYVIRTSKIAWKVPKGHRLRLEVTSGAENLIFPNPNTGENFFEDTQSQTCTNRIHHGGRYLSRVSLPVVSL